MTAFISQLRHPSRIRFEPAGRIDRVDKNTGFQWNLGGWLGGQLGGTCWILVAAVMTFSRDSQVAAVLLGLFAAPNLIGWRLWAARDRLSPLRAMQALVFIAGAFGLAAVFVLERSDLWDAIQVGGRASASSMCGVILAVVAGLLALFHLISRQR